MRLSVCVMADIDEIDFYPHVESLGYDSAWVTDSQMLFSDLLLAPVPIVFGRSALR